MGSSISSLLKIFLVRTKNIVPIAPMIKLDQIVTFLHEALILTNPELKQPSNVSGS